MVFSFICRVENGYITFANNRSNRIFTYDPEGNTIDDFSGGTYLYDDVVAVSCHRGYKFHGNHSLLTELKLQCSGNGTWTPGTVPNCIPRVCPRPNRAENARIYLKKGDNATVEISRERNGTSKPDRTATEIFPGAFTSGTEIITACEPGYQLVGDKIQTCTEEETWSSTSAFCEPYNCSLDDHSIFKLLRQFSNNKTVLSLTRNDTDIVTLESIERWYGVKNITVTYKSIKIFVEGNAYGQRMILTCQNNMEMNLNKLINETVLDVTWTCNRNAKWEILNSSLKGLEFEEIFDDSVCDKSCAPPEVSFKFSERERELQKVFHLSKKGNVYPTF